VLVFSDYVYFIDFCLSEPGSYDYAEELIAKYGSIMRVWFGPRLVVALTDAKLVEVSKLALAV
jgi:hypothetical protein